MIILPVGFDYGVFIADLLACVAPFIPIMMLIVGYRIAKSTLRKI
jgi:hypothetical protein